MINLTVKGGSVSNNAASVKITSMTGGLLETFRHWPTVIRGSLIGTIVGAVPGVGGVVASFLSYSMTVQAAKETEKDSFGKGNIKGVIAPEAAINAKDCSALIPTLAFGIPGGVEMAVFMGILIVHGMQPGPLMLVDHQVEIYGLIWALTASCVLASFVGLLLVRPLSRVTLLDSQILVPMVLCVAFAGSYAIDMTIENVVITAIFGVIGYLMIRFDYPRLTIVIALVLGASAERNFHQSMLMSDGQWAIYLNRPICLLLLAGIVVLLGLPIARGLAQQIAGPKPSAERS
jgi:putative tricarboxylic transport membrane protein